MNCKYCNSEMELMDSDINYGSYICMDDDCNGTVVIQEGYDDEWER